MRGHRAGRDRRDPRPPPHRLDRDARPGDGRPSTRSARPRRSSSSASARTGMEPSRPTATMLLGAVLSDTVILNSPTTTERDRARRRLPRARARRSTRATSAARCSRRPPTSSDVAAEEIVARDAKEYEVGRRPARSAIAQIETVGQGPARPPRRAARRDGAPCASARATCSPRSWSPTSSREGTELLVAGDAAPLERAFGERADGRRDRPAGRDEPQEAGRAEAARAASG